MQPAILVENLSKRYRISHEGDTHGKYRTLRDSLAAIASAPFRRFRNGGADARQEDFWALKDVSFEVKPGEVVGIIGRNGAGKSTLLKILSRITKPTTGQVTLNGRVGSLLEVGTGFHPELTGRENIFLNGSILGMKREEITKQFDAIVDFSGVEQFLDTPVKRYSSGMYVRLAFAVAAHLDPEILVVDEVLAVGDAEFQKKCLGKMQEVSRNQGRTVLFVSHNMTAMKSLCRKGIHVREGRIADLGAMGEVIDSYLSDGTHEMRHQSWPSVDVAPGNELARIKSVCISSPDGHDPFRTDSKLQIEYQFWLLCERARVNISTHLRNALGEVVFNVWSDQQELRKGVISGTMKIPANFLNDGKYTLDFMVVRDSAYVFNLNPALGFEITDNRSSTAWHGKVQGAIRPVFLQFPLVQLPENQWLPTSIQSIR